MGVDESFSYEEVPVKILDWQVKSFGNNKIGFVNVLWGNYLLEGDTWEADRDMKSQYLLSFLLVIFKP